MMIDPACVRVLSVSLEYTLLDLSEVHDAALGEEVVVLGRSESTKSRYRDADWAGMPVLDTLISFDKPMPTFPIPLKGPRAGRDRLSYARSSLGGALWLLSGGT